MKGRRLLIVGLAALALTACGSDSSDGASGAASGKTGKSKARDLAAIQEAGVLRVATRNAPTSYYIDRFGHPAGPEYDLVAAFADSISTDVEIIEAGSSDEVLTLIQRGQADIGAAGLTITDARAEGVTFSTPTQTVTEQVVCNREGRRAKSVETLPDVSLAVSAGTTYADTLQSVADQAPGMTVKTRDASTEQLLRDVWQGKLDCTVADSHIFALNRRYFPTLVSEFDLSGNRELAWAMPQSAKSLVTAANRWLERPETKTVLADTQQQYYAMVEMFDFVDMRALTRRIDERFPKYDDLFEDAGSMHGIDHILLAAQGYQESHWDPKAKSPTGVRGIMMLTKPTAESLGVSNRLDPKQSIEGGSRYLARMKTRFSEEVTEPDRTYLALAAYNVGRAHMHDAQKLARDLGKSPYKWDDIKTVLPLLSEKKYYSKLKYGYARGHEPVRYVERIRNYEDVIRQHIATK